jgi:protein tyrosine phosphatase (PTP) superfamily phosphohydrolase (DUF442 family)
LAPWQANFDWVAEGLAVGGRFPCGFAADLAREHGVGAVIDLRSEACDDAAELKACGIRFLHLPTPDTLGVSQPMLDAGVAFAREIASHGRSLLIHCEHGIGRSATLALCVMVDRGIPPVEAIARAKGAREPISPSEAQYRAWACWIARNKPEAPTPTFHDFGVIAYRHLART